LGGIIFGIDKKEKKEMEEQDTGDPYYQFLRTEEIALYQSLFNKIINEVDVENYTKWSKNKEYDYEQANKDNLIINKYLEKAKEEGMRSDYLHIITLQYFFADWMMRDFNKKNWVKKVVELGGDFFPSAR
ncbi:MAG: hypothetical protein R6U20_08310, partial [Longimonas sp.]|uniref:hypothetical protein n=1 Tax=Longimonas sp. TaxID=2039626 RepID=UPI003975C045